MYSTALFLVMVGLLLTVMELFTKRLDTDTEFMDRCYTDRLRGIAATIVVISHVSGLTGTRIATPLGGIGVALFLICSGFGMYCSYSQKGLEGFWKGKIKRILVPYWIAILLFYGINFRQVSFSAGLFIRNFLLIKPIPYLWFVQYLMICNIIFWIIFGFIPKRARVLVLFVISVVILLCIRNDMYAEQGLSFLTGLLLGMYHKSMTDKDKALKIGGVFLAISITFLGIKQFPEIRHSFYIVMNIIQMLIKLFGACGILYVTWRIGAIWNRAFVCIGKCSYEVYIVHTLLIPCIANSGVNIVTMAIYMVVCIMGVILLHKMLQKLEILKMNQLKLGGRK